MTDIYGDGGNNNSSGPGGALYQLADCSLLDGPHVPLTVGDILRVLGASATGAILMALGDGPRRTKELVDQVPHYAPRTIYRYTDKLVQLGLVGRDEQSGVPSVVTYELAGPGAELHALLQSPATAWLPRDQNGEITVQAWASLGMLAELWDLGIIDELSRGGRSVTELSRGTHDLSYHQISRRIGQLMTSGFLEKRPGNGTSKCFQLTAKARRGLSLVAALGRWRERQLGTHPHRALTEDEMTTILRAALPLVELPSQTERYLMLAVGDETGSCGTIGTVIGPDGEVRFDQAATDKAEARARGDVDAWLEVLLDGSLEGIDGAADATVDALLSRLYACR